MSKVLVTGSNGYIGSVLVPELKKLHEVNCIDLGVFDGKYTGDVRNPKEEWFDGVDAVIHLAGISTDPTSQAYPRLTDLTNHIGTEKIATMAYKKGIKKFIFASTCSIYFNLETSENPPEYTKSDLVSPISCYSLTKRFAEECLLEMADDNFKPIIFRMGTIYGHSPRMRYDLVLNSFVKDSFLKRKMLVDSEGLVWRPIIDIQDVIKSYVNALDSQESGIFNLLNENITIGYLAQQVKEILKEINVDVSIDYLPYRKTRNYKASSFLPRTRSLEEAILEMWDKLEKSKINPEDNIYYNDRWYREYLK